MRLTRRQLRQLILEEAEVTINDADYDAAKKAVTDAIPSGDDVTDDQELQAFKDRLDSDSQNESITLMKKPMHNHDSVSIVDFMGRPDHEGKMAYKQLKRTSSMSQSLCHRLEDKENIQLPAWVQSKITKAADYIQSVYNYLDEDLD